MPLQPDHCLAVIGDIHGRDDLLQAMLDLLAEEELQRWVFVGDYVDRGPDAASVLARLKMLDEGHEGMVCLLGNHEKMMLDFLDHPKERGPRWIRNGGSETLASFGITGLTQTSSETDVCAATEALRDALPAGTEDWLRSRPLSWQSGNLWVVHGAADPEIAMDAQEEKALLWGHRAFLRQGRTDGNWVAHGHTIVDEATAAQGRIAVDTGAYATDRLTAAIIAPGADVRFVQT